MAVSVDRVQDQLLDSIAFDEQFGTLYPIFKHVFDILRQERSRSGGDTDVISSTTIREGYPWQTPTTEESNISSLYGGIQPNIPEYRGLTVDGVQYTAMNRDLILAKNNATILFPQQPEENAVIIIRNDDGSNISINGNGKTINGEELGEIVQENTTIQFHYVLDADKWVAI